MMDHARHLSSPSPTSPFLFHHSESRPFKSSPSSATTTSPSSASTNSNNINHSLTPLLTSAADVNSVDDCFVLNVAHHQTHISVLHNHLNHHHNPFIDHHGSNSNQRHSCQTGSEGGVDLNRVDSLSCANHHPDDDDDDDDGMHNMLSGSSTSSTSTMPLLTESHSHHSFSRISLEEYSPLSLVEDCDNVLQPISPTSLACGHHHSSSFKTSLNELKMDNLVGDVGSNVVDHDVDVNDARSLSPTLLSSLSVASSNNNNHNNNNLWSNNSSTAITQNTSLLNGTSTPFLLAHHHHHHHQLNSFMQQLEPQSLDEAPQLNNNQGNNLNLESLTPMAANRPSSEPPQSCGVELHDDESKSVNSQPIQAAKLTTSSSSSSSTATNSSITTSRGTSSKASNETINTFTSSQRPQATATRTRKSRSRSNVNSSTAVNNNKQDNSKQASNNSNINSAKQLQQQQPENSSKFHLQLTHHKKLQELQQRLFGINATSSDQKDSSASNVQSTTTSSSFPKTNNTKAKNSGATTSESRVKQEPDSSEVIKSGSPVKSTISSSSKTTATTAAVAVKTRNRGVRTRRSRAKSDGSYNSSATAQSACSKPTNQKSLVKTETAEPDTTTKSSLDCIKLADLLAINDPNKGNELNKNSGFILAEHQQQTAVGEGSGDNNSNNNGSNEKRVQQIQLQVSPSLTVVTNSGLMQSLGIQQHQQNSGAATVLTGTSGNQILCRPGQSAILTTTANPSNATSVANGSLKGILSNNELLKGGETVLTNWSIQTNNNQNNATNNNNNSNNNANSNIQQTSIGAHQIAIQVICQDGTSLVLPVSSAAGLNAAVSLTSQHQQLQAVLANNANQQRNGNQLLMSVQNIVNNQQINSNNNNSDSTSVTQSALSQSTNCTITNGGNPPTSGLAASSPTLAALLDASSNRSHDLNNNINFASQNFVSTNLLRKLVTGAGTVLEAKQQDSTNCNPLVTVCTPSNNASNLNSSCNKNVTITTANKSGDKRIKLENVGIINNSNSNNLQTFTLIDSQGLIVTNGNEKTMEQKQQQASQNTSTSSSEAVSQQTIMLTKDGSATSASTTKQNKMGSSTGNRQVDPTQPFRCEHCNSTFTRLGNFTRHKKIHTVPTKDGQRFKCDVCSKSFLQRCDLARHLHIHRGTEPHRCNICGKGYIRHSDLVTHQRFHNKEKPFGCPHCSKGFCQRGKLLLEQYFRFNYYVDI